MQNVENWFRAPADELAARLQSDYKQILDDDGLRQKDDRIHAGLYGGGPATAGFSPSTYMRAQLPDDRIRWNVCKPVVDSAVSKLAAKNPPRPMLLTSGGDWVLRDRAKKLEKFIEGCFYEGKVRGLMTGIFRDAAVFGTGILKIFEHRNRVSFERILRGHLYTDYSESMNGKPSTFYEVRYMSKDKLKALYPRKAAEIDRIGTSVPDIDINLEWTWRVSRADQLEVIEAFHVSDDDKKPGRYAVVSGDVVISDTPWNGPAPYLFFHWSKPLQGFWGTGIIRDIRDVQREINQTLARVHDALRLYAVPRASVEKNSGIEIRHLRGGSGALQDIIFRNPGAAPPQFYAPAVMPPEVYNYLESQYIRAFELSGVSQLTAQSRKPPGLDSGIALRIYHDIETERFATIVRAFEDIHIELAQKTIACARKIFEKENGYTVATREKYTATKIDWAEVNMDEDRYQLQIWPASTLPQTPAGRLEYLTNLKNANLITDEQFKRVAGFPDIEAEFDLDLAPMELIDKIIGKILYEGTYIPPEPFYPLEPALIRAESYYMRAQIDGMDEERLILLRRFMKELKDYAAAAQAELVAQMQASGIKPPPGLPPGAPPLPEPPPELPPA